MSLEDALIQEDKVKYLVELPPPPPPDLPKKNRTEVYIAIRMDDSTGSGTVDDPYNGRDDIYLDKLLRDPEKITPEMTIRFGPGVFQTRGNGGGNTLPWVPSDRQRFIGAGMYQTTLQLIKAAPGTGANNYIAPIASDGPIDGLEVSDMTIDSNLARQPLVNNAPPPIRADAIRLFSATNIRQVSVLTIDTRGL